MVILYVAMPTVSSMVRQRDGHMDRKGPSTSSSDILRLLDALNANIPPFETQPWSVIIYYLNINMPV